MAFFSRKNFLFAVLILSAPTLGSSIILMKGKFLKWGRAQQRAKEGKIMDSTVNFPCIKFDPTAPNLSKEQREAYEKYQNLMQYGYPTDVPLSQAVKEFNDCFPNLASRQPIIERGSQKRPTNQ